MILNNGSVHNIYDIVVNSQCPICNKTLQFNKLRDETNTIWVAECCDHTTELIEAQTVIVNIQKG